MVVWGKDPGRSGHLRVDCNHDTSLPHASAPGARIEMVQGGNGIPYERNRRSPGAAADYWHALGFNGDVLLIAAKEKGVGVLDLTALKLDTPADSIYSQIRYVWPNRAYWPVVKVIPLPGQAACVAVEENSAGETVAAVARW